MNARFLLIIIIAFRDDKAAFFLILCKNIAGYN